MLDHFQAVADGEAEIEVVRALVDQQHRENLEIDQPLHLRRGARQHLIQIQRGVDFAADFRQHRQRFGGNLHHRIEFDRVHLQSQRVHPGRWLSFPERASRFPNLCSSAQA